MKIVRRRGGSLLKCGVAVAPVAKWQLYGSHYYCMVATIITIIVWLLSIFLYGHYLVIV